MARRAEEEGRSAFQVVLWCLRRHASLDDSAESTPTNTFAVHLRKSDTSRVGTSLFSKSWCFATSIHRALEHSFLCHVAHRRRALLHGVHREDQLHRANSSSLLLLTSYSATHTTTIRSTGYRHVCTSAHLHVPRPLKKLHQIRWPAAQESGVYVTSKQPCRTSSHFTTGCSLAKPFNACQEDPSGIHQHLNYNATRLIGSSSE